MTSLVTLHAYLGGGEPLCRVSDQQATNDVPRVLADPAIVRYGELGRLDLVEQLLDTVQ